MPPCYDRWIRSAAAAASAALINESKWIGDMIAFKPSTLAAIVRNLDEVADAPNQNDDRSVRPSDLP